MALSTRAQLEAILIRRAGRWLTAAGLDGITIDGTNDALADPIARAIRVASGTVTDDSEPVDADVSTVADTNVPLLADIAELYVIESAIQNYTKVDVSSPAGSAQLDDLGQRMERARDAKRAAILAAYGATVLSTAESVWSSVDVTFGTEATDEYARPSYWFVRHE